mmetsp:Transcript_45501/g.108180  ORF Transcript_45501/g.108180 Transcript_45501/m.108180 type:complete len:288 (+) Transcript_45501:1167-2030(+)
MPALEMATALHQLKVVEFGEGVGTCHQRLDHRLLRIVHQHQDVGQLQWGLLADGNAGREPIGDRLLGGSDQSLGVLLEAVHVQVQRHQETLAASHVRRLPVDEHKAGVLWYQDPVPVVLIHLVPDASDDLLVGLLVAQVHLWEDEVQRGGGILHQVLHLFPVLWLRGVLVAGDDAPLAEVQPGPGQQHPRHLEPQIREAQPVRAAEHLVARRPDAQTRQRGRRAGQVQHVAQQDRKGDVTHAPRYRGDLGRHLHRIIEAHVPHDARGPLRRICNHIHPDVNHDSSWL